MGDLMVPKGIIEANLKLNDLVGGKVERLRRQSGPLRRFFDRRWLSRGIASEVHDDWLTVCRMDEREVLRNQPTEIADAIRLRHLATAGAYSRLARESRDLTETWTFINQAELTLCRIAEDQLPYLTRMAVLEPLLDQSLRSVYRDQEIVKAMKNKRESASGCEKLTVHARQWYLVNLQNSLSLRLWQHTFVWLLLALSGAIAISEIHGWDQTWSNGIRLPFLTVSILGFFGGALSALLRTSSQRVTATTYRPSKSQVAVRLLLGASGAFVLYLAVSIPQWLNAPVQSFVLGFPGILILGVVGGFSERLFLTALNQLEERVVARSGQDERDSSDQ